MNSPFFIIFFPPPQRIFGVGRVGFLVGGERTRGGGGEGRGERGVGFGLERFRGERGGLFLFPFWGKVGRARGRGDEEDWPGI